MAKIKAFAGKIVDHFKYFSNNIGNFSEPKYAFA